MSAGRVALVALGGTISMRVVDNLAVPSLDARGVGALLGPSAELDCVDVARVGGSEVDFGHLRALHAVLAGLADADTPGVIVTTGTDSVEETAAWCTYTGPWPYPLVVTGSMRPGGEPGGDAPANLAVALAAVRTPLTREPVVAFNGRIWLGRQVQKVSGTELDAFRTPGRPALGRVHDGVVTVSSPAPGPAMTLGAPGPASRVIPLLTTALGAGGDLLKLVAQDTDAVVVAGNGAGNLPPGMATAAISLARSGVLVAVATRAADARTGPLYGYPGSGGVLEAGGVVLTPGMTAHRVRVLLTIAASQGHAGEHLRSALTNHLESLT